MMYKKKMKAGGVTAGQMGLAKAIKKKMTASQKGQLNQAKMGMESKPLLKMAKMGMSVDMVEPMMTRMDQAAYGLEKMMKGGMPKRGMRTKTHMKNKKKSSK